MFALQMELQDGSVWKFTVSEKVTAPLADSDATVHFLLLAVRSVSAGSKQIFLPEGRIVFLDLPLSDPLKVDPLITLLQTDNNDAPT